MFLYIKVDFTHMCTHTHTLRGICRNALGYPARSGISAVLTA